MMKMKRSLREDEEKLEGRRRRKVKKLGADGSPLHPMVMQSNG